MASLSGEASAGEVGMSEKVKATIEHIFSVVEYFILIGAIGFIAQQTGSIALLLLLVALSGLLGLYTTLPLLVLLPRRGEQGIRPWAARLLFVLSGISVMVIIYFVGPIFVDAALEGIGV